MASYSFGTGNRDVEGQDLIGVPRISNSLRNSLKLERPFALRCELLIHLVDYFLDLARNVATQFSLDASGMYSRSSHATSAVALVEGNGEEDIRRLGSAIGDKGIIGGAFKVGVFKVNI